MPYIPISRLMQSENGISIYISVDLCKHENDMLLLFYIFLSHGNEQNKTNKQTKNEIREVGCKKGDAVSCPQVPVCCGAFCV